MFVLFCCVSSFPSVLSLCLLCVAGGVAGSLAAADEAHLLAIHLIIPSIKAWSSHHFDARLFRLLRTFVCLTTRLLILSSTRISKPASTLPLQPASTSPTNKPCYLQQLVRVCFGVQTFTGSCAPHPGQHSGGLC